MPSNMDKDRRHPCRQFNPALVASYLLGRKIESVQLMALGKSNTNYRLILTDGEVCVLRLHNPGSNTEREKHILHLVKKVVPVPALLASGSDWSIHSFVEGTTLADAPQCVQVGAEALARIASIPLISLSTRERSPASLTGSSLTRGAPIWILAIS
jgi:hypothetical protein